MLNQPKEVIRKHIKTHTVQSADDSSAVSVLKTFLRSNGRINTSFTEGDKWPNHDGTFEFVSNPSISRRPEQNFFVQIKGTHVYTEKDGIVRYSLQSLAFPAFICLEASLDPGILFVVLNPDQRGSERVFWKYMSVDFLNSINFENDSTTIRFSEDEEIQNTDESVAAFCEKLEVIISHHSFVNQLGSRDYSRDEVVRIINVCDTDITEYFDRFDNLNDTRDNISRRILTRLNDFCTATLLLNSLHDGIENASLQLAWERSILSIETKYLGTFLMGLQYIGRRIPDDGQSERLMLKYYDFLWQIRKFLRSKYGIYVLNNLEKFPLYLDEIDKQYYIMVASVIDSVDLTPCELCISRYYIQKKIPFFIGTERYYEITLQLAGTYASKYNRITAYTKENISTNYSVQIGYVNATIDLWGVKSQIKVISNWQVSIDPVCLNKLGKVLHISTRLSSQYGEYRELMSFLTKTGANFLDLIDLQELAFSKIIDCIYQNANTPVFKEVLIELREHYSKTSNEFGRNVIRYLLLNLREETFEKIMPSSFNSKLLCDYLFLSRRCFPFEKNPFISNLAGSKTNTSNQIKHLIRVAGTEKVDIVRPYLYYKNLIRQTGEIYFEVTSNAGVADIRKYNSELDRWERGEGYQINLVDGFACIDSYEQTTLFILRKLLEFSSKSNKGQREYNLSFLKQSTMDLTDPLKKQALQNVFVNSRLLLIYGAAGTGKTTLINYISNLMANHRKLFLTKTHTAKQNLKRRIDNPGISSEFVSIDSFTKKVDLPSYDIIFIDECSTIDNRTMKAFLSKVSSNTFLVLAGDIHQIESIEFGNWFFYAKDVIKTQGANVELLNTWRTKEQSLISLWNEVRAKDVLITEKLAMDGPFSEDIGPNVFERKTKDEVILCLNYDGKFGLNNMNNYFQAANTNGEAVFWEEWTYKIGDPILFNDSKRFPLLYNNLKGRIISIDKGPNSISFTVDVDISLTERDCSGNEIEFVGTVENGTRIRFTVYAYESGKIEGEDDALRVKSVIPFQLAYAVSIHKAQGLEYDSVKVIIPSNNAEKITHGVFYTAITRAKKYLKIYWSSETMQDVIKGFAVELKHKSIEIVKAKLSNTFEENTKYNCNRAAE